MGSPITNLPLEKALYLRGLQSPNKMGLVYAQDYGYNVLTQLTSKLGSSESTQNAKVEISGLGSLSAYSLITAASTTDGQGNLVVSVVDGTKFRKGDHVADDNLVQGQVLSTTSNTITLGSRHGAAWNTAVHFTAGKTAKVLFDASPNRRSTGKSSLNYVPDTDYTYTAVTRDSASQGRRDRVSSFVKWEGDYWYRSFDQLAMQRFSRQLEFKYAFSERNVHQGPDGEYYTTAGLRWSIINNGGTYMPLSGAITQNAWHDFISEIARKVNGGSRRLVALMGTDFLAAMQGIVEPYIKQAGNQNTFGGVSVKGLDVMTYSYGGITIDFVKWGLLDDEMFRTDLSSITGKPRMSSSCYILDLTPIPAADGSGMLSPVRKFHFNNDELIANYVPGMIGLEDSNPSTIKQMIGNGMGAAMAASDIDAVDFHVLSDCGTYFMGQRMGLIELTA